jgi:predicted amidophosphoribosyltransferase
MEEVLRRTRATDAQVHLDAETRLSNVRGAFAVVPGVGVEGRTFVLVDDVITTGSTLAACAAALVTAGATSVSAVTVAREI